MYGICMQCPCPTLKNSRDDYNSGCYVISNYLSSVQVSGKVASRYFGYVYLQVSSLSFAVYHRLLKYSSVRASCLHIHSMNIVLLTSSTFLTKELFEVFHFISLKRFFPHCCYKPVPVSLHFPVTLLTNPN